MDDGGFDNNAKIILGVDEADEFVHVLFQQTMLNPRWKTVLPTT